jgi:hypothetical protein
MNERIKELAEQATTIEYGADRGFDRVTFDKEKFAQLIVQDCMKVAVFKDSGTISTAEVARWMAVSTAEVAGWMAAGRSTAAKMIKEHFGVEE